MNQSLQELSNQYCNYRIIPILEKAGWHISQTLKMADNIKLMHLNPYSPEQNPVELLWGETRRIYFHNLIFNSLDDVENTLAGALLNYQPKKNDIMKLSKDFLPI